MILSQCYYKSSKNQQKMYKINKKVNNKNKKYFKQFSIGHVYFGFTLSPTLSVSIFAFIFFLSISHTHTHPLCLFHSLSQFQFLHMSLFLFCLFDFKSPSNTHTLSLSLSLSLSPCEFVRHVCWCNVCLGQLALNDSIIVFTQLHQRK